MNDNEIYLSLDIPYLYVIDEVLGGDTLIAVVYTTYNMLSDQETITGFQLWNKERINFGNQGWIGEPIKKFLDQVKYCTKSVKKYTLLDAQFGHEN